MSPRNQGHEGKDLDEDLRDLQENNQLRGVQSMPPPEERDVRKAGGGTKGDSQGGALAARSDARRGPDVRARSSTAHTGRRGSHSTSLSNRETSRAGRMPDSIHFVARLPATPC